MIDLSGHYGYRRILLTMLPMILTTVVISVYSVVDGFFISNYAGTDAFAGINLVWPAIALVGAFGLMVGCGGSALVAKTLGEGNDVKANEIFTMLIALTVVVGYALALVLFIFMPQIVTLLGADEAMTPYALTYGRILATVLPLLMLQQAFQPFFMVAGKPHLGTILSIICGVINIVLDYIFVAKAGMGLKGAAYASSISIFFGGVYPLLMFSSRTFRGHIRFVRFTIDASAIVNSMSNGLSEFVSNVAMNVLGICYNLQLMKHIGANGVSAYGIIMYLAFIYAAIFIGYNMGISQVISYNYGAKGIDEIKSLLKKSLVLIGIAGIMMTAFAEISSPVIARIFVGFDKELCDLTIRACRLYMLSFLICGFNYFISSWFTALNNGIVSAVAAMTRMLVFELGAVFILPVFLGVDGIWMAIDVAEVLALVLSVSLLFAFRRRYGY